MLSEPRQSADEAFRPSRQARLSDASGSKDTGTTSSVGQAGPTGSRGPALMGNRSMYEALSGASIGGLGSVLRQEQAFAAAGMESDAMVSNTAMLRAMLREHVRHASGVAPEAFERLRAARAGSGRPLELEQRARFEQAFDHDFSHVRIHADGSAAMASEALSAHAFALGADLFFASGAFAPGTERGDRLLAHELTHVVQYDEGRLPSAPSDGLEVSTPSDPHEREAYANEATIVGQLADGTGGAARADVSPSSPSPAEGAGEPADAVSRSSATPAEDAGSTAVSETSGGPPLTERILASEGEPLSSEIASAASAALGVDVSSVVVHDDAVAAEVGERVGRGVFSVGHHLFLADGQALDEGVEGQVGQELRHAAVDEPSDQESRLARALDGEEVPAASEHDDGPDHDGALHDERIPHRGEEDGGAVEDPDHLPGVTDGPGVREAEASADPEAGAEEHDQDRDEDEDEDEEKHEDQEDDKDHEDERDEEVSDSEAEAVARTDVGRTTDAPAAPALHGTLSELAGTTLKPYVEEKALHESWAAFTAPTEVSADPAGGFAQATVESMADGAELALMQMALGQVGIGLGPGGKPAMNLKAGEGLAGGKNFAGGFLVLGHMAMVGPEQWFADMGANTLGKGREGVEKLFGEDSDLITRIAGFIDIADAVNNAILYASYIAQAIAAVCFALAAALSSNPFTAALAPAMLTIANFAVTVGDILATVNTVFGLVIMGLRAIHVLAQALRLAIEDADPATQAERVQALQDSVGGLASELTQRAMLGAAGGGAVSEAGTADNHTAAFRDEAQAMMDEVAAGRESGEAAAPPTLESLGIPEGVDLPSPPIEQEQALDAAAVGIAMVDLELAHTAQLAQGVSGAREQVERESDQIAENQMMTERHHEAIEAQMAELEAKQLAAEEGRQTTEQIQEQGMESQGTASELFGLMGSAVSMLLSLFGMAPSDAGDTSADTGSLQGGAEDAVASADPVADAGGEGQSATELTQQEIADTTSGTESGREDLTAIEGRLAEEAEANQEQASTTAATEGDAEAHMEILEARRAEHETRHAEALEALQAWTRAHQELRMPDGVAEHLDARLAGGAPAAAPAGPSELDRAAEAAGAGRFEAG